MLMPKEVDGILIYEPGELEGDWTVKLLKPERPPQPEPPKAAPDEKPPRAT
jgi:hypothetical protein